MAVNNRIPRKLKKEYKKIWFERTGEKMQIIRSTIQKEYWADSPKRVWGCLVKHL